MVIFSEHTIKEESFIDCKKVSFTLRNEVKERKQDRKIDLTDFTFLMPLRIDSEKRRENADTTISYILRNFDTPVIVVEGDGSRKYYPDFQTEKFHYEFIEDKNVFFHKTKYINRLIESASTRFIAVWDADVIAPPYQILESVMVLRKGEVFMSVPYDGRVYVCENSLSDLFRSIPNTEILLKLATCLSLMYGYCSTGGAFMADRERYLEAGGENENFLGWGPEDFERVKRMEILHQTVHFGKGPLFHLWHPRGRTSWYADKETEIRNRRELIKTCRNEG
jgi:hypothetical protein